MRVPERSHALPDGLVVEPRVVPAPPWQAHVIKHPFGLGAMWGAWSGSRRWNTEGWDRVAPPVLEEGERASLTAAIGALHEGEARCRADKLERTEYRGEPRRERMPCYECALAERCGEITRSVGERYASWVDRLLAELAPLEAVPRNELALRLQRELGAPEASLPVVLSVGRGAGGAGARVQAPNGVRVELALVGRDRLEWWTTYRKPARTANDRISALLDVMQPLPSLPLSGMAVVPRRWWRGDSR